MECEAHTHTHTHTCIQLSRCSLHQRMHKHAGHATRMQYDACTCALLAAGLKGPASSRANHHSRSGSDAALNSKTQWAGGLQAIIDSIGMLASRYGSSQQDLAKLQQLQQQVRACFSRAWVCRCVRTGACSLCVGEIPQFAAGVIHLQLLSPLRSWSRLRQSKTSLSTLLVCTVHLRCSFMVCLVKHPAPKCA